MMRTASIRLVVGREQASALDRLRSTYASACNLLVPLVRAHRCWNRVSLHKLAYRQLRAETALGSQMVCNAIFAVCKAYKSQKALGRIGKDEPMPAIRFDCASVHYDKRTYTLKGDRLSLYTLAGRITVMMRPGKHQRRLLRGGAAKEAELVFRAGQWWFNLVIESASPQRIASGPILGVDVGENTLAAASTGKVLGGEHLRDERDRYLALRRRLQSNGSFECGYCGLRAHSDVNASCNLASVAALIPTDAGRPSRISGDCRRQSADAMSAEDARPRGTIRQPVSPDRESRRAGSLSSRVKPRNVRETLQGRLAS